MPSTYTLISSNILTSTTASVTFSSIPATYTDLVLRLSTRTDLADTSVNIYTTLNGDTATNYSATRLANYAGGADSARNSNQVRFSQGPWSEGTNLTASTFANSELYIPSYTASQNKPVSSFDAVENNSASTAYVIATASLWRNTAAITSVTMAPYSGNFVSGSSFYLYGISKS
jgi:hypothetical protein